LSVREFKAEITVLKSHSTTIRVGYEPIIHAYTIRQSAKILSISNKINARLNSIDDNVLRTGDKATATFRFMHYPEYLKSGSRILMAEGMVKVIGVVM
jgi:GTPase